MIWPMEILNIKKKRTLSDKILKDKAYNIAKNPKYDGYQRGLASPINYLIKSRQALMFLIMTLNKIFN